MPFIEDHFKNFLIPVFLDYVDDISNDQINLILSVIKDDLHEECSLCDAKKKELKDEILLDENISYANNRSDKNSKNVIQNPNISIDEINCLINSYLIPVLSKLLIHDQEKIQIIRDRNQNLVSQKSTENFSEDNSINILPNT